MIRFTNRDRPNFHLKIMDERLQISTTINVPAALVQYLEKENVHFAKKRYTYFLSAVVELSKMNEQRILVIANNLIDKCMCHTRIAKNKLNQHQIDNMSKRHPVFTSSQS